MGLGKTLKYLGIFCLWMLKKKIKQIFFFVFGKDSKEKIFAQFFFLKKKASTKFSF